jgi:hypothetical protein
METTKKKLSQEEAIFFQNLKAYINTPIYFFGSIQRDDYLQKHSDIDVDIFTNDEKDVIINLESFLNVNRRDFKKTLCIIDNIVVIGYKIKYIDDQNKINVELCIFNEKYKKQVINLQKDKFNIPYYVCIITLFFKILYYELNIIPIKLFRKIKNFLIGLTENDKENFIILDID